MKRISLWLLVLLPAFQTTYLYAQDGLFLQSAAAPAAPLALIPGERHQLFFATGASGYWFDFESCKPLKAGKLPEGWTVYRGPGGDDPPKVIERKVPTNGKIKLDLNFDGIRILDMEDKPVRETPIRNNRPLCAAFSADGKRLYICFVLEVWICDAESFEVLDTFKHNEYLGRQTYRIMESPDTEHLLLFNDVQINVWDRLQKKQTGAIHARWEWGPQYDAKNDRIYLFSGRQLFVVDPVSLDTIAAYEDRTANLIYAQSLDRTGLIAIATTNGYVRLWNWKENKLVATTALLNETDYVVFTPEHYYLCNREFTGIALRRYGKIYSFREIDFERNRPDLVLSAVGLADERTLALYQSIVTKRKELKGAEKPGEQMQGFTLEISLGPRLSPLDSMVRVRVRADDSLALLKSLHILINEVPIFGRKGLLLTEAETRHLNKVIDLNLVNGNNFIEAYVENDKGAISFRRSVSAQRAGVGNRNLHLICVGISKYLDPGLNLKNARPDAEELAQLFQSRPGLFENVYSYYYFDQNATKAKILSFPAALSNSSVNDLVVFFFAGHGRNTGEPILCTYDMTLQDDKGIRFSELYDWMLKIPARQKLIILDACEMGELDEKEAARLAEHNTIKQSSPGFRGSQPIQYEQTLFDLVKTTFMDIRRNYPGVVIISSTKATERAPDKSVFQDSLIRALTVFEGKSHPAIRYGATYVDARRLRADLNEDGSVMANELLQYLATGKTWENYLFYDFPVWQNATGLWKPFKLGGSGTLHYSEMKQIASAKNYEDLRKLLRSGLVVHGGDLMYYLVSQSALQKADYQLFFQQADRQYGGRELLFGDQKARQRIVAATFQNQCKTELLNFLLDQIDVPIDLPSALFNPEGQGMSHLNFRIVCPEILDVLLKRKKITREVYNLYLKEIDPSRKK